MDPLMLSDRSLTQKVVAEISKNSIWNKTLSRLVSEGCNRSNVCAFIRDYAWREQTLKKFKEQLDTSKTELGRVSGKIDRLTASLRSLGRLPLSNSPLADSYALAALHDDTLDPIAGDYLFTEVPQNLERASAYLRALKQNVAEYHSIRKYLEGSSIARLYLYCCAAARRPVTYKEIAELLNAGLAASGSSRMIQEGGVSMSLRRFKAANQSMPYADIEKLMCDYVTCYSTEFPSFDDWYSKFDAFGRFITCRLNFLERRIPQRKFFANAKNWSG